MIIEHVRIAVLDAYDNILTFLDNHLPKALHYYNDTLTEYLKGSAYTYTFTASADHEDSQYLVEGNKIAFVYRQKSYYLNIMTVEKDEYTVTVQAFGLLFELLNEEKEAFSATKAMTFADYLNEFDPEHIITLGNNEVSDKSITYEWTGTESMLARLYSLATVFGAEIEFVAELNQNYSLAGIILNVYQEHSDTVQGIGTNRTDQILRYGKEVDGIRKTSDITDLYTAIRPTGSDGLTIASVVIEEYDADGNLEYSSPQGNRNIYAVQARDRFPSNLTAPSTERYIALVWSYDTDNANTLAGQALARLKEVCTPQVSYEVSGYIDADIGDTFTIQDTEYTPQLLLSARVTEQQRSFTDPANNKTTFDNFRELQSEVDQSLLDRVEELIEAGRSYSAYINSNNGLIFKNNTGSTTLTASVTSGTTDVTGDMTIRWFKDGAAAGSGTTLTVNASDVSETAVYSIQSVNGNGDIVATTQVTIADVYDGAAGQQGPAGTSSYTHIAYANSADGTVDFSVTDSNREYIGFYVDNVQADSTDPSDYKWTLIKGADGSQGVPGPAGADGKTPYFHIAYSTAADGSTGFSTTDPTNKTYIGQYTDYTAADSQDPSDYTWAKFEGPKGATGAKGETGADGQMLYATSSTAAGTAAKVATLAAGSLTLKAGATVSVRFTYANTASSPTLNVNGTGAKAIYTQGVRYAYWSAGATVIFTYDGSNWRVCSEPVYANTVTVGNASGKNVYIDGDSVDVRTGSTVDASFGATSTVGRTNVNHIEIGADALKVKYGNETYATIGRNGIDARLSIISSMETIDTNGRVQYTGTQVLAQIGDDGKLFQVMKFMSGCCVDFTDLTKLGSKVLSVDDIKYQTYTNAHVVSNVTASTLYMWKYPDGRLEYYGVSHLNNVSITTAKGSFYRTSEQVAIYDHYPIDFVGYSPNVSFTLIDGDSAGTLANVWFMAGAENTAGTQKIDLKHYVPRTHILSDTNITLGHPWIAFHAIGRWK